MSDGIDQSAMLLGEMKAQIVSLQASVVELTRKSDERGARTYKELEGIRLDQAEMRQDIKEVKKSLDDKAAELEGRLDAAEPTLKEINRWRERFIGIQMFLGALTAAIGGMTVYFWKWIAVKIGMN